MAYVKSILEAVVDIYADDGTGELLDEIPLFTDCFVRNVSIQRNLEVFTRQSTGRPRPKKWARHYDYSASFGEFYISKTQQHDVEDIYNREVRLQFWLRFVTDPDPENIWKLKIALLDSFVLSGEDNGEGTMQYSATVTAEMLDGADF